MRGDRPIEGLRIGSVYMFTPHARGSTCICGCLRVPSTVYPACAGIDRSAHWFVPYQHRLPRMRGDRPIASITDDNCALFTPHARGSTPLSLDRHLPNCVYPACAGIDLGLGFGIIWLSSLPRMRGDRPSERPWLIRQFAFTPHARGSTPRGDLLQPQKPVYPACAGIDLHKGNSIDGILSLPRMRGDRPIQFQRRLQDLQFTPHARGSTARDAGYRVIDEVYPACAGIDLFPGPGSGTGHSLPRMRGDRPITST